MKIPFLMMIPFAMAALNVPFIVADPAGAWGSWASAVFCFGVGIAMAVSE